MPFKGIEERKIVEDVAVDPRLLDQGLPAQLGGRRRRRREQAQEGPFTEDRQASFAGLGDAAFHLVLGVPRQQRPPHYQLRRPAAPATV